MVTIQEKKLNTLANYHKKVVLEGYDVYLASGFYDSNGRPSQDCPIYIDINDNGKCIVVKAENITNWEKETIQYIKEHLPQIVGPICRYVSPSFIQQSILPIFVMELSREVYDRNGNVVADIFAFKRKPSDDIIDQLEDSEINVPTIEIMVKDCQDRFFLKGVIDVVLKDRYSEKYKGMSMWYKPQGEDYTVELGFLQTEMGISYKTIE